MRKMQFRKSVVVAAISMMAAGGAFAAGNTLVGPDITSTGAATVNINQVGVDNVVRGATAGAALVVNNNGAAAAGAVALTIQQVGVAGTSGANTLGLTAHTSGATKIRVFQGGEAAGPGGTTGNGVAGSTDIGTNNASTGNTATITLGSSGTPAGASNILVSQQGADNVAALTLGSTAFTGVMQVVQKGARNAAVVAVSGQTETGKTFNIGQAGSDNALLLTAVNVFGDVTANFGGVNFAGLATTSNPTATGLANDNNAKTYLYAPANGVAGSTREGINLGSTAGFNLEANGGLNNVQVDFSTANALSKVNVALAGGNNLAIYGNASTINVGGTAQVAVNSGNTLAVSAAGGSTVGINGVTFDGNGFFSSTLGSQISVTGGTVNSPGMSVLQTGGAHVASITGTVGSSAAWDITQSGTGSKTATLTNSATGANWTVAQSGDGIKTATLTNSALGTGANWTVVQSGAGAMALGMNNATNGGVINVSQSGAADQSATGINFAAALGSSFTLAQK